MPESAGGPGDIQIIPPGVGHAWSSIDAGGVDYLVYRVVPDHLLAMPKTRPTP